MKTAKRYQVFVSYAHEDLGTVRQIVCGLRKRKLNVWFDKEDLGRGRWKQKIVKAISKSRFFVICISEAALLKTGADNDKIGFQDEELNIAYNIALDQPDSVFTIVPVRLEDCGRGDFRISSFQQYDLFDDLEKGLDKLSIDLGGISLSDATAKDDRTEDEKIIKSFLGKAIAANYAGDYNKAIKITDAVLEIKPDDAEAWHSKGIALGNLKHHEKALEAFNEALQIEPDNTRTWRVKCLALSHLSRFEEALEAANNALKIKPDAAKTWYIKGVILGKLSRFEEALEASNKALEIKPDDADAWHSTGIALGKLNRFSEALEAFNKALDLKPDLAEVWYLKGLTLGILRRFEEALEAFNKALEIEPDNADALLLKNKFQSRGKEGNLLKRKAMEWWSSISK